MLIAVVWDFTRSQKFHLDRPNHNMDNIKDRLEIHAILKEQIYHCRSYFQFYGLRLNPDILLLFYNDETVSILETQVPHWHASDVR